MCSLIKKNQYTVISLKNNEFDIPADTGSGTDTRVEWDTGAQYLNSSLLF